MFKSFGFKSCNTHVIHEWAKLELTTKCGVMFSGREKYKILEKIAEKERVVKDIPNSILQAKQMLSDIYKFPVRAIFRFFSRPGQPLNDV